MLSAQCYKVANGFYSSLGISRKCKECKTLETLPAVTLENSSRLKFQWKLNTRKWIRSQGKSLRKHP